MEHNLKLNVVLARGQDRTGAKPNDVPTLTLEGNEAGLLHLISLLQMCIRAQTDGGYHTHLLHADEPGISLTPEGLVITFRRVE